MTITHAFPYGATNLRTRNDRTGQIPETRSEAILTSLLLRVGEGRHESFADLYDLTAARVFGVARRVLCDIGHAEDVTQEVFLEIWRTASHFDRRRGSALSWIIRLAHSRAVDRVRHAQAARLRDTSYATQDYRPEPGSALEGVLCDQDGQQIRAVLMTLTPLQREALTLTYFDGHTYAAASAILGIPVPTLKSRIRSALIALRAGFQAVSAT